MERLMNRAGRSYLRKVQGLLPCSRKMKCEITAPLRRSMAEYLAEQPDATAESLRTRFGAPEVIAATCLEDVDTTELLQKLRVRRRVLTIVITAAFLALLSWGCTIAIAYHNFKSTTWGGVTEKVYTQVTYTEETSSEPSPQ